VPPPRAVRHADANRRNAVAPPAPWLIRVIEVDPQTDPRWEAFVSDHPDGLVYHHPAWLQALQREYGRPIVGLVCQDSTGRLRGILPLCETKGLPFRARDYVAGRRLSSLPRTPVCGPLAIDASATAALVQAAAERARARPGTQLQLKVSSPGLNGIVDGLVPIPWRLTYVLKLPANPDDLGVSDSRARRRNSWAVNKARRLGVSVRLAQTEDDLRAWHRLYLQTMRDLAVPARSYRFFQALWETLRPRGLMRLLLAEQQQDRQRRLLAGSLFLTFGRTFSYAFTGWQRGHQTLRANDLIHWQAMHDACREGFEIYDFGEVAEGQEGLAAFKAKWGAEPRRLYRYHHPAPERMTTSPLSGRGVGLLRAAWRRLPLGATSLVGDYVYGYL
jgi:hypothetical protein